MSRTWEWDEVAEGNETKTVASKVEQGGQERTLDRIMWLERRVASLSTLYSMATADRVGLNLTDMVGLGLLAGAGPMTHGELAALIGLSGGAVTGLVDRLERLGLVRRERDVNDRRRVLLHVNLNAERAAEIEQVFAPMQKAARENLEGFAADELEVISRYNEHIVALMQEAIRQARAGA